MTMLQQQYKTLRRQQPELMIFALSMLGLMVFALCAMLIDERTIRGVGVWDKPMKFMASSALFAVTTAWAMQFLPVSAQRNRASLLIAWTVIITSLFEVLYITFQGANGIASHYNISNPVYAWLFNLMALAAVGLTASQATLAWQLYRRTYAAQQTVFILGLVLGLSLTFVLATVSGFALGVRQAPVGVGLPILGWHLAGGDFRPAHFLGVHAQQFIPIIAWLLFRLKAPAPKRLLCIAIAAYTLTWFGLMRL